MIIIITALKKAVFSLFCCICCCFIGCGVVVVYKRNLITKVCYLSLFLTPWAAGACGPSLEHRVVAPSIAKPSPQAADQQPAAGSQPAGGQSPITQPAAQPGTSPTLPTPNAPAVPGAAQVFSGNPYVDALMLTNPDYVKKVQGEAAAHPDLAAKLNKVAAYGKPAIWLDSMARIAAIAPALDEARKQAANTGKNVVATFVIYDLPLRDCSANASNGELTRAEDLSTYESKFIDQVAEVFSRYSDIRISAIVEPDSLGNLVTNVRSNPFRPKDAPRCDEANDKGVYVDAIVYAIKKLAMSHVSLYLDSAHGGWLGWENNMQGMAAVVAHTYGRSLR